MNDYFKFPSTRHIVLHEEDQIRGDKVLSLDETMDLLGHEIIIEEKIDGANLGISFDHDGTLYLQNRGNWLLYPLSGQWKKLEQWIAERQNVLFDFLLDQYILFGEWCYATHSVYYNRLPDYFIGFDVYDKAASKFFSVERRNKLLKNMSISKIYQCAKGRYHLQDLTGFFGKSHYGSDMCEGIYLRWDENGWLKKRAKLVREGFKQSIVSHWQKGELKVNHLEAWYRNRSGGI